MSLVYLKIWRAVPEIEGGNYIQFVQVPHVAQSATPAPKKFATNGYNSFVLCLNQAVLLVDFVSPCVTVSKVRT